MNELNAECMSRVFYFLSGRECGVACCTAKGWKDILQDDIIWQTKITREYCEVDSTEVCGQQFQSYRSLYAFLSSLAQQYPGLAQRALGAWKKIEAWLRTSFPKVLDTLVPGATEEQLNEAESAIGLKLPAALRAIYRVHAGQDLSFDRTLEARRYPAVDDPTMTAGLLGGYQVYNHLVFMRLLTLPRLVKFTQQMAGKLGPAPLPWGEPYISVAASFPPDKALFLRASDATLVYNSPTTPCHPPDPTPGSNDGMLRWMEEYASRLERGVYKLANLEVPDVEPHPYISLFPRKEPEMVTSITRGVRVQASTVFIGDGGGHGAGLHFTYSIRMALLSLEEQLQHWPPGTPFKPLYKAQLTTRHWCITDGPTADEIEGPGVIGEYPLLTPGGEEFVYQSRTSVRHGTGTMEGHFMFVEGSRANPTGPEFAVACPTFELKRPDFVF